MTRLFIVIISIKIPYLKLIMDSDDYVNYVFRNKRIFFNFTGRHLKNNI